MSAAPPIGRARAVVIFLAFAFTYFLSALLRGVTATLAPVFSAEMSLGAADLGLLAGAYFFGFALMQLPLGRALDRVGPRRTLLALLAVAALGCVAFALANDLAALIAARGLIGVGVAACLMAPLTCYRRVFSPAGQLRANAWMLMAGSSGMVASTLPVQWSLPSLGWRGLFWALAVMLVLAMAAIRAAVPSDPQTHAVRLPDGGYAQILRHPKFRRLAPLGFFVYGGLVAVQALWAGPWLTTVSLWTPAQAAQGLFGINVAMLLAFGIWGAVMPRLVHKGIDAMALMRWGLPWPVLLLFCNVALGSSAGALHWAAWCVGCTFVTVSLPAVGSAFPSDLAGRALSAFNLVVFCGIFCIQWGIGLVVDALSAAGVDGPDAFRVAFGLFGSGCLAAYAWFVGARSEACR